MYIAKGCCWSVYQMYVVTGNAHRDSFLLPGEATQWDRLILGAAESCKLRFVYRLWNELSQAMQRPGGDRVQEKTQNFGCRQQPNICSCFKPLPHGSQRAIPW